MKLVIGCPVANRAWVLPRWHSAITWATEGLAAEVEIICITTPSTDGTEDVLWELGVEQITTELPTRPADRIGGHHWGMGEFDMMSVLRNQLAVYAWSREADWFFSLDSDILATPGSVSYLIEMARLHDLQAISPLVNLGKGAQVSWNFMSLYPEASPKFLGWAGRRTRDQAIDPPLMCVDMIAAAMLIHRDAREVQWQAHPQGEDVGYAINLREAQGVAAIATNVVYTHLMREDQ